MSLLKTDFLGLKLKNPVTTGAGTFGYVQKIQDFIDVSNLGAVVVKGTSLDPWSGNSSPRIWETPSGMLNAIGLQNPGLEIFMKKQLPALQKLNTKIIVSIFDRTVENFVSIAQELNNKSGIDALEINLSCPNVKAGGVTFCAKPKLTAEIVKQVRQATKLPLIAKLSPNVTDIVQIAKTAVAAGADGLSLINTLLGMAIDIKTRRPRIKNNIGGLSGPAIHPVAVARVWQVREALPNIPIIGLGGVDSWQSALELILAGANVVGIGTANFYNPLVCLEVIQGLERYCYQNKIKNVSELVGQVKKW